MKECIICRKTKNESEFNIEHIVQESLGNNKLKIYVECTTCNSRLGSKIEEHIINFFPIQHVRYLYKIPSKGKIPKHPLEGFGTIYSDNFKCQTYFDKKNLMMKARIIPTKPEVNGVTVSISGDPSDKYKLIEAVDKRCRREGLDLKQSQLKMVQREIQSPKI